MIIFLHGSDDYRREQRKKFYIEEFRKKYSGLSLGNFDLAEAAATDELKSFARGESLFEIKKLAVVGGLEELDEAGEKYLAKELPAFAGDKATTILFSERKTPRKALAFLLEKPAIVEEFAHLSGYEGEIFIRGRAKKLGLEFSDFALKFLVAVYQGNSWGLVTELEKISNLKNGVIDKKDLSELDLEIAPDYWALFGGLKDYDIKNRLTALEKLFAMGDQPPKIFNILAAQWREKIPRMAEYDLMIKSGKLDYEEALVDILI